MKRSRSFQLLRIVCHYEINRRSTKMVDRTENMIELLKWLEWNIFRTRSHREPWDRGTDRCVRFLSHTGKNIVEATRTANSNNIPITNNNNKQQQQYRHVHMPYTAGYNSVVHTGNRNGKVLTVPPLSFMTIHHPTLFIFILTGETTTRLQASLGKKGNKKKKKRKKRKMFQPYCSLGVLVCINYTRVF